MPIDDAWDWPILLYVGTVTLKRSERAFWRMTPRKLNALAKAHVRLNSSDEENESSTKSNKVGYIDNVI